MKIPHTGHLLTALTVFLTALAYANVEAALAEQGPWHWLQGGACAAIVVILAASAWRRGRPVRSAESEGGLSWRMMALLVLLFVTPFLVNAVRTAVSGEGQPLERLVVQGLRGLACGLTVLAARRHCRQLAALVSFFLVMIAAALGDHAWVQPLMLAYAIIACFWLILTYWEDLAGSGPVRGRFPLGSAAVVATAVGGVLVTSFDGRNQHTANLGELLSSSGGTSDYHAGARGGLGDGEDEARGSRNAQSVGFTDSDYFLDTPQESLYDVQNDLYGEPLKPRHQDRTLALDAMSRRLQMDRAVENLRATREFPLRRGVPRLPYGLDSRAANALVYVKGRLPVHLRLVAYDFFDGAAWHEGPEVTYVCHLERERSGNWLRLARAAWPDYFGGFDRHQVKIAKLQTAQLPAPAHLHRFRLGKIDDPGFFAFAQEELVRLKVGKIPAGVVLDTEVRTVRRQRLANLSFPAAAALGSLGGLATLEPTLHPDVLALAREWSAGRPRGWAQVEAVVGRLREHCVHDRAARPHQDVPDPLHHFLFSQRCGPDYLFATAAALMLRGLGYPTRVVSGLYVHAGRYDPETRHALGSAEDVHFWVELFVPGGGWLTIEPTPGFEVLAPVLTWRDYLDAAAATLAAAARRHGLSLGALALVLALGFWRKRQVLDRLATAWWRLGLGLSPRVAIWRTLALLDRRAAWAGVPRPPGRTPRNWYVSCCQRGAFEDWPLMERFLGLAAWASFAPPHVRQPEMDVAAICRTTVEHWTLGRLRQLSQSRREPA